MGAVTSLVCISNEAYSGRPGGLSRRAQRAHAPPTVARGVRAALADPAKAIYFVAETGGLVVGQLMITHEWSDWRDGDVWWIQSVYVHPDFRRRGVFRALHEHARREARRAGAVGLRLYVERDNVRAQATYAAIGMHETAYRLYEREAARGRDER